METRSIRTTLQTTGRKVSGYAVVFNSPTTIVGERARPFTEVVRPGALRLNEGLKLLWSHDTANVLASTSGGTLQVRQDEHGLYMEADLPESAQREREALARGDVSGMSFRFSVNKDKWADNRRELLDINISEVSLVAWPAYPEAKISGLRSRREMELQLREKSLR